MKAVVFDFDGVIVNTYEHHYQTFAKVYENLDRETHKKLFEGNLHGLKQSLKIKDSSIDEFDLLKEDLLRQKISKNILEVLKNLKKDYLLFIISSHKESILGEFLEKEDLSNLFDKIYGFETHRKKDVKFEILFKEYGLNNDDVVFVTDTLGDILEANKLHIKSIAVDFGFHERERLEKGNPYKIVSNFGEIYSLVLDMD